MGPGAEGEGGEWRLYPGNRSRGRRTLRHRMFIAGVRVGERTRWRRATMADPVLSGRATRPGRCHRHPVFDRPGGDRFAYPLDPGGQVPVKGLPGKGRPTQRPPRGSTRSATISSARRSPPRASVILGNTAVSNRTGPTSGGFAFHRAPCREETRPAGTRANRITSPPRSRTWIASPKRGTRRRREPARAREQNRL